MPEQRLERTRRNYDTWRIVWPPKRSDCAIFVWPTGDVICAGPTQNTINSAYKEFIVNVEDTEA